MSRHLYTRRGAGYYIRSLSITLSALLLLFGCSPRIVETVRTEYRDTTVVRTVVKDSLIMVPIPLEKDQAIVHVGDTSKLQTSVAESTAYVGSDGLLHHSLRNRSESFLPAVVPVNYHFEMKSKGRAETLTKFVEVEKQLSAWQRFRIGAFWWLLLIAAVGWRREILWLIRKAASLFG